MIRSSSEHGPRIALMLDPDKGCAKPFRFALARCAKIADALGTTHLTRRAAKTTLPSSAVFWGLTPSAS